MSICSRSFSRFAGGRQGGKEGANDSREALSRETNEDPNERRGVSFRKGGKKIFREENRFQVPDSRSGKRLLFQRNFYIYPLVKRKPRICFYSRILLVTSHSGFPFLFSLSFLSSFFLFYARHVLFPPPRVAFARNTQPNTRDFQQATPLIRLGRVELLYTEAGVEVVYFVSVWIDFLATCLQPRDPVSKLILSGEVIFSNVSSEVPREVRAEDEDR